MDIFTPVALKKTVENLDQPASHLLDTFFPNEQTETSAEIHFDTDESKPALAPMVHPSKAGVVVDGKGFKRQSFTPGYVKDKRVFDPAAPLRTVIGEKVGGELSPMQRRARHLRMELMDQQQRLTRRQEVMAAEALLKGTVTCEGEGYPEVVVDFGRSPNLTVTLAGADKWDAATSDPQETLESVNELIMSESGASGTIVTMDPLSWKLMRRNPEVREMLDRRRGTSTTINTDPQARRGNRKSLFKGMLGDFEIWVYQEIYLNDAGALTKVMPDHTMIMSGPDLDGTRCYGAILDEKAGYAALKNFTKSWMQEDPAVRYLLTQQAPLVAPYRVNASAAVQVA